MRWDLLFADLEAGLDAAAAADRADAVAALTRAERASVRLADRVRAHDGPAEVLLVDGSRITGEVRDAAPEWLLLAEGPREHLVLLAGVAVVGGLTSAVAPAAGQVLSRLGLGHALRGIAQDRSSVRLRVLGGELHGRVVALGALLAVSRG